jgi:hypothetical protein
MFWRRTSLALVLSLPCLLPACGDVCKGCTNCPDLKKTYAVTLLSTSFCKVVPTFTNTLAHISVLRQEQVGEQTNISLELSSLVSSLQVGLVGNLCAALDFNASYLQRDLQTGASTNYSLAGSFLADQGKDPRLSATLTISYFAPQGSSDTCSSQVQVSPL